MKIYTRRGDTGTTGLYRGASIEKHAPRIAAIGDVDELNSLLGCVLALNPCTELRAVLPTLQDDLFHFGAELASLDPRAAGTAALQDQDVARLEGLIDLTEGSLEPLRSFILPGGSSSGAMLHLARAVARRAERSLVLLDRTVLGKGTETEASESEPKSDCGAAGAGTDDSPIRQVLLAYLNRLADLLFVLARRQNQVDGVLETRWSSADRSKRSAPPRGV